MSGINTLIDTVLHSVLGKRVDHQPRQDLNQPVRPLDPNAAPNAVRSDSRLNPRSSPLLELQAREGPESRGTGRELPRPPLAAPPSARASFSPAAQLIADVLSRFPSPPSVLRSEMPLLTATLPSADAPATRTELASQLRASISDSGLFYENQLARWYRGELPRQALERQPQMQFMREQTGQPPASVRETETTLRTLAHVRESGAPMAGLALLSAAPRLPTVSAEQAAARLSALAGQPGVQLPAQVVPGLAGAAGGAPAAGAGPAAPGAAELAEARASEPSGARVAAEDAARAVRSADLPESLQGLVRHQLELLATPVLRWEGDVWSGIFLALFVQVPETGRSGQGGSDQDDQEPPQDDADEAPVWRSELTLDVAGLGLVKINVHLQARRLRLVLQAEAAEVLARLQAGQADLQSRLQNSAGFADTHIRVRALGAGGDDGTQA